MATLNEWVSIVADALDRAYDVDLKEDLKFSFKYYRALLLRRDIATNTASPLYFQTIQLQLQLVDSADSCYVETGCKMLRTILPVPMPVRLKSNDLFKYVGTSDKLNRIAFGYIEFEQIANLKYNKYTSSFFKYNWTNSYIYIINTKKLGWIEVEGIWEDPSELKMCECYSDDNSFPIPMDMGTLIVQSLLNGEYKILRKDTEVKTIEEPQTK